MLIKITRSFERTRQIADFVPVKAYCEASTEYELGEIKPLENADELIKISAHLQFLCESEVEKTLMTYRPACIVCGGKSERSFVSKEGVCGQCMKEEHLKIVQLNSENRDTKKVVKK